jgi:hypothetical protein
MVLAAGGPGASDDCRERRCGNVGNLGCVSEGELFCLGLILSNLGATLPRLPSMPNGSRVCSAACEGSGVHKSGATPCQRPGAEAENAPLQPEDGSANHGLQAWELGAKRPSSAVTARGSGGQSPQAKALGAGAN